MNLFLKVFSGIILEPEKTCSPITHITNWLVALDFSYSLCGRGKLGWLDFVPEFCYSAEVAVGWATSA